MAYTGPAYRMRRLGRFTLKPPGMIYMEIRAERSGDIVAMHLAGMLNMDNLPRVEDVWLAEAEKGGAIMAIY